MQELTRGYGLIEGPVWLGAPHQLQGLLFSDVLGGGVFRLAGDGQVSALFEHRRGIGGMAWHEADGLIVSGRNVSFKAFAGGATQLLLDRDEAGGNVGYNDLTTDSAGRIYVGSLGASPVFDDGREPASGDLYLIDLDGSARQVAADIALTNGLGFSPDGRMLYHSDSRRGRVNCYAVADNGDLGPKQLFVEVERGIPDGLAVARDGSVWVALAGGGQGVSGFAADGRPLQHLEIPDPMCTSVCFGGPDLEQLYIVSGSEGAPGAQSGAVYRVAAPVPGLPVAPARVKLPSID